MNNKRLWMYPYDEFYNNLLKYSGQISKYKIIGKLNYNDKLVSGEEDDFDFFYKQIETFDGILVPDISNYSSSEICHICKVCRKLITEGKSIIAVNDKHKINGAVYLNQYGVSKRTEIDLPVIALLKADSMIDNFNLCIELKEQLEKKKSKVVVLSSNPYSNIFDDYIMIPDFMHSNISSEEKIENIISYVMNILTYKEYDIMLLDCPIGLLGSLSENKYNFLTYELLQAFMPDYSLVQILAEEYINLPAVISILERKSGVKINSLVMSNLFFDRELYTTNGTVKYFNFFDKTVDILVGKISSSNIPIFSVNSLKEICNDIYEQVTYNIDEFRKVEL